MMRDSREVKSPAYHSASRPDEYGVQSESANCSAIRYPCAVRERSEALFKARGSKLKETGV